MSQFTYPRDIDGFALCHHGRRIACLECIAEEEHESRSPDGLTGMTSLSSGRSEEDRRTATPEPQSLSAPGEPADSLTLAALIADLRALQQEMTEGVGGSSIGAVHKVQMAEAGYWARRLTPILARAEQLQKAKGDSK